MRPGSARRGHPIVREANVRELRPVAPPFLGTVLCSSPVLARFPQYLAPLKEAGFEVQLNELGRTFTEAELTARLDGVVATVAGIEPYNETVLAAAHGAQGDRAGRRRPRRHRPRRGDTARGSGGHGLRRQP